MHYLMQYVIDFSCQTQQFSSYLPQSVFKVFYCNSIYWIGGFNDLIYPIKNVIAGLLVECLLVVQV
jgi:hypothetical protein